MYITGFILYVQLFSRVCVRLASLRSAALVGGDRV